MQITIIGAGNMARGIATRALSGRHTVRLIDRDPDKAARLAAGLQENTPAADVQAAGATSIGGADIVVLALPYQAARQAAAQYAAALSGKTLIDISNPVDLSASDSLIVAPGTSAAEQIAAAAPAARVVKAFNTTFAGTLIAGQAGGAPLDVFIAGDDAAAKQAVTDLATSGGLHPIDAGPLKRARELEGLQLPHMTLQQTLETNWSSAIKILT
jgi:predicted dinucleotide-binding enzyme